VARSYPGMWWMTTTPPRAASPSGWAMYASISSPPCPAMVIVVAVIDPEGDALMSLSYTISLD